jgi:mannosylglycerate hydrolase
LLAPLHAWHRFLLEARDPNGFGEPVVIHPWESGRDNSIEWDDPLFRVTPEVTVVHRRDTDSVDAAERPTDEHYRRYLTLVRRGTAVGWHQEHLAREGGFRVLDPGFSAILARAADDLGWLADQLGQGLMADESRAYSRRVSEALRARTDSDGLIRAVDTIDSETLPITSAGSALVALVPDLGARELQAVRELVGVGPLASHYGVRSLDAGHPQRSSRNYWRGPVWANVTWLCAHALALHGQHAPGETLRARMLRAADGGGMREYFLPDSGEGLGARDFAWTAALTLRELAVSPAEAEAA